MDDEAQALAYAQADFGEPHTRFVDLLRRRLPGLPLRGDALDLGCGPGDVALRFARAFPQWAVEGIDGSPAMLRLGCRAVVRAGLEGRVLLHAGRLPGAQAHREHYALVFANSLLHHLADPGTLWECVLRWTAPGGAVFVMDLIRPRSRRRAEELVQQYAAEEPERLQRDFFASLLAAYRMSEVKRQLADAGLAHLRLERGSDRHLVVSGCC